jgi:GNAT superfamily N-acetyltransferase
MQTDDEQAVGPAEEIVDLAGSAVIFRWLSLREGGADPDVVGLDGGLRALLEQPDLRGGVLIAVGPGARLVGAAGSGLTSGGASAAVAVTDRWQGRGLGRELDLPVRP